MSGRQYQSIWVELFNRDYIGGTSRSAYESVLMVEMYGDGHGNEFIRTDMIVMAMCTDDGVGELSVVVEWRFTIIANGPCFDEFAQASDICTWIVCTATATRIDKHESSGKKLGVYERPLAKDVIVLDYYEE